MSRILIIIAVLPALILLGFYIYERPEREAAGQINGIASGTWCRYDHSGSDRRIYRAVNHCTDRYGSSDDAAGALLSGDRNCGGAWKISGNGLHYMEKQRISAQL